MADRGKTVALYAALLIAASTADARADDMSELGSRIQSALGAAAIAPGDFPFPVECFGPGGGLAPLACDNAPRTMVEVSEGDLIRIVPQSCEAPLAVGGPATCYWLTVSDRDRPRRQWLVDVALREPAGAFTFAKVRMVETYIVP